MDKIIYYYTVKINGKKYQYRSLSYHIKTIAHILQIPKKDITRGAIPTLSFLDQKYL
jgi:hypothetical protein